jgi:hypothetical protein
MRGLIVALEHQGEVGEHNGYDVAAVPHVLQDPSGALERGGFP